MVKSLALGFGTLTALALAGAMTPTGQAMLGQRHVAEQAAPVASIQDKPAPIPGPAQSFVAAPAPAVAPKAVPASAPARGASPAPRRPQAVRVAPRPQPAPRAERSQVIPQNVPAQGAPGGFAGVANILLNLPQVLSQNGGGPSQGPGSWTQAPPAQGDQGGRANKRHRDHEPSQGGQPGEHHDSD